MIQEEPIYITGHMHPDTDSIAAAIAYAFFKRAKGHKAIPCRLGKLNSETKYLLNRFGFEEPMFLEDARKTLGEIELDSPVAVTPDTTIYETVTKMTSINRPSFAVVDEEGKVQGLISKSDLANLGLGDTALGIDLMRQTSVEDIRKTISGTLVYDDPEYHLNGKVSIVALSSQKYANYEIKDRIVILGDDPEAQKALIEKGAGLLIVVWAKNGVQEDVIEAAKKYHCPVIISGHGTMNTSRYIYFAPPVKLVMTKDPVIFHTKDLAENAGRKMMQSRYRTYPVVDNDGKLAGYVSRYHIMNYKNKRIILVDHNEFSQSVRAVEKAQLLEVVDHHRICDFATTQPVSFRNEIVGSTATIIATMFRENQIPLPTNLAGLLLGAVLSDTLMFQSPTTTQRDRDTANILAAVADLDIEEFGNEMFTSSASSDQRSIAELINQDIKYFDINNFHTMVSQVIVPSIMDIRIRENEVQATVDSFAKRKELDLLVVLFTSVIDNGSIFFAAGEQAGVIDEAFPNEHGESHSLHKNILSRKSQVLPILTDFLSKRS
ncbi:MAG: putative manganese-dependent inorganic diphosphatase [Erysipelotrichales bacterium]|nr:putative manganese-dependent inorganic diphosphatase [Erysipelotrichales bacterium]